MDTGVASKSTSMAAAKCLESRTARVLFTHPCLLSSTAPPRREPKDDHLHRVHDVEHDHERTTLAPASSPCIGAGTCRSRPHRHTHLLHLHHPPGRALLPAASGALLTAAASPPPPTEAARLTTSRSRSIPARASTPAGGNVRSHSPAIARGGGCRVQLLVDGCAGSGGGVPRGSE